MSNNHAAHPLAVEDLRGLTLRQLDLVCSEILGLPPPRRPASCPCDGCQVVHRGHRPAYGPPRPPSDLAVKIAATLAARRLAVLAALVA